MRVYILLTDTGTLFTKAIKLYTKQPFNHASISFDIELDEVYSFGRKVPSNPFVGGFVRENLQNEFFQNARCAVYSCEVTAEDYWGMLQKVKGIEDDQDSYRYNLLGVLAVAAKLNLERRHAYFCSQFVAIVLQEAGIQLGNKPAHLITPFDIQNCSKMRLMYKGNLRRYPAFDTNLSSLSANF